MELGKEENETFGLHFSGLPPEIRIAIYEYCLQQLGWTFISDIPPICHVSRQMRYETLPVLYRLNDLGLDLRASDVQYMARVSRWGSWRSSGHPKDLGAIRSFSLFLDVYLNDGTMGAPASWSQTQSSVTAEMAIAPKWFAIRFLGPYELSPSSWKFLDAEVLALLATCLEEKWDGNLLLLIVDSIVNAAQRLECVPPWPRRERPPKRFVYERNVLPNNIATKYCWSSYEWGSHCPQGACVCPDRSTAE